MKRLYFSRFSHDDTTIFAIIHTKCYLGDCEYQKFLCFQCATNHISSAISPPNTQNDKQFSYKTFSIVFTVILYLERCNT